MRAKFAQQCTEASGKVGSYLYVKNVRVAISPVFPDTLDFFKWCDANGWREVPGTYAREYEHDLFSTEEKDAYDAKQDAECIALGLMRRV